MQLRQKLLIILFFSVTALALMVPLASNTYLPESPPADHAIHTGTIVQAKMAMDEGQFPIRIAPWQHEGYRYPEFQFYGPLPYTIAGAVYHWITPDNPYSAFKMTLWLSLVIGGLYVYRLSRCLVKPEILGSLIGLLAGFIYMSAPYFLINVNVRGDLTEAVAQGILPVCLYYCLDALLNAINVRKILCIALSIFALSTSHVVTFIYSSLFVSIFITLVAMHNKIYWKRWLGIILGYSYSILLGAWYWGPMLFSHDLLQANHYLSNNPLANPFNFNWLTPIAELLSPIAISPMPLPGNHLSTLVLSPSIGLPILLSVGAVFYLWLMKRLPEDTRNSLDKKIILIVFALFSITFFAIWSPVDFWQYLPSYFRLVQFPYRLLMQATWMGVLLFIYAARFLFMDTYKMDPKTSMAPYFIISVLFIGLACSSWLISPKSGPTVEEVLKKPDIKTDTDYLIDSNRVFSSFFNQKERAFIKNDIINWTYDNGKTYEKLPVQWLILNKSVSLKWPYPLSNNTPHFALNLMGSMRNTSQDPIQIPMTIMAQFNQKTIAQKTFSAGYFDWTIPLTPSIQKSDSSFFTLQFNRIISKSNPVSSEKQQHDVSISHIQFIDWPLIPVKTIQNHCHLSGMKTICGLQFVQKPTWIQLPVLYYPDLLDIKVDGRSAPIGNSFSGLLGSPVLTDVWVTPGHHQVIAYFRGLLWANNLSLAAWASFIIISLMCFIFKIKKI